MKFMQLCRPDPLILVVACTLMGVISGCAHAGTPGEQFRKIMADIDKECRERQLGPYEPEPRKTGIRNSSCDILFLKPYDPLATEQGRFAHSIQLPPPYDKPKDVYKPGMNSEEYFKALCAAEAGEFIFKTIANVEGVLQTRPYEAEPELLGQFFAYEGIGGLGVAMYKNPQGFLVGNRRRYYNFFEMPVLQEANRLAYQHWVPVLDRDKARKETEHEKVVLSYKSQIKNNPLARYGFTQRGLVRTNDREYGIRGAELILVNLNSKEPLAFRRVFHRYYFDDNYLTRRQVFSEICPNKSNGFEFIQKILIPTNHD